MQPVEQGIKDLFYAVRSLSKAAARLQRGTRALASIQRDGPAGNFIRGNVQSLPGRQQIVPGTQERGIWCKKQEPAILVIIEILEIIRNISHIRQLVFSDTEVHTPQHLFVHPASDHTLYTRQKPS